MDREKNTNHEVYIVYKPLRNYVRKFGLPESLSVIWAYSRFLQFGEKPPNDLEVHYGFLMNPQAGRRHLSEWVLAKLLEEVVLHADLYSSGTKSMRKWNDLATAINKLHGLESEVSRHYVTQQNVLTELNRIAHQQLPWQDRPNQKDLFRYYKIYSHQGLNEILTNKIGLDIRKLHVIASGLLGAYLTHFACDYPMKPSVKGIETEDVEQFLNIFSCPVTELRAKLGEQQQLNEKYAYSYNDLIAFPLVEVIHAGKKVIASPIPTMFFRATTNGLYYRLYNERGFDKAYGDAFQSYVGEVINRGLTSSQILPEREYAVGKNTTDWVIQDNSATIFLECKGKRLQFEAKTELLSTPSFDEQLGIAADSIVQVYKNINYYLDGQYPTDYALRPNDAIYPIVTTLEDWRIFGHATSTLRTKVEERMKAQGLPLSYLQEMPYLFCCASELEEMVQIMDKVTIKTFLETWLKDSDKSRWSYVPFASDSFGAIQQSTTFLFADQFAEIYEGYIALDVIH